MSKYRLKRDLPFAKAGEKWKDIKDFEGYYQVSNYGEVKSLSRTVDNIGCLNSNKMSISEKILKQNIDSFGYPIVNLNKKKIRKTIKVHLLVWDAFGNKPRNGRKLQVDHIDNNKRNNHIDNLQLLSNQENCQKGKDYHKVKPREYYVVLGKSNKGNDFICGVFAEEFRAEEWGKSTTIIKVREVIE